MPHRLRWVVPFCVAVVVTLVATTNASATTSARRGANCDAQVNDTPSKLIPCIQQKDLWQHMQNLQAIADANPSPADGHASRNSGEPGYKASADYVAAVMKAAGYNVTLQPYKFTYFAYTAPPGTMATICMSPPSSATSTEPPGEMATLSTPVSTGDS